MRRVLGLTAAAVLAGISTWLYLASIATLPAPDGSAPEYVFFLPAFRTLLIAIAIAGVALGIAVWWLPDVRFFPTLTLLALPLCTVALLATPARAYAPPWVFLFFDLRWWLLGGIAATVASGFSRTSLSATSTPVVSGFGRTVPIVLLVTLALASLLSSPRNRFEGHTDGDEPKYLRFAENWYRGRGMDITNLGDIKDVPAGKTPALLANVRRFVEAAAGVASDLAREAGHVAGWSAAPPRATEGSNQFVTGKRGGLYQIHYPGVSLLLLPAYSLDRLFNSTNRFHPQFPTYLYATNIALTVFYLLWGLVLFGALTRLTNARTTSAVVAAVVLTSLPAVAFTYQYYPEAAAGLIVTAVTAYIALSEDRRPSIAFGCGLAAGYLPWLHLRFGFAPLAASAIYAFTRRGAGRSVACFAAGAAIPLATLALYNYHIAGSVMPWVLWDLQPDSPGFNLTRMTNDLPRIWTDRSSGILEHAPIYLMALPGLFPLWRRRPIVLVTIVLMILPVAIMSAAHSFTGGWTTPGRLMAAVVPLLALPMGEGLTTFRRGPWFVAFFAVLGVVSSATGLLYNGHFVRTHSELRLSSVSGWATPLLFTPGRFGGFDVVQLFWWALTVVLISAPFIWQRTRRDIAPSRESAGALGSMTFALGSALVIAALVASALGASSRRFADRRYLQVDRQRDALLAHLGRTDGIVWSGSRGLTHASQVFPLSDTPVFAAGPERADAGVPVDIELSLRGANGGFAWGVATVRFGDDNTTAHVPLIESASVRHTFESPGAHRVLISVEAGESVHLERSLMLQVDPRQGTR